MAQSPSSQSAFSSNPYEDGWDSQDPAVPKSDTSAAFDETHSNENTNKEDKCACCDKYCTKELAKKVLKIWAIGSAVGMGLEGMLCITRVVCTTFNLRAQIISLYYGIFGAVVILTEVFPNKDWLRKMLKFFKFMRYRVGRALFYLFLGTICIGEKVWSYIIATNWIILGIINIIAYCYCLDDKVKDEELEQERALRAYREDRILRLSHQDTGKRESKFKFKVSNEKGQSVNVNVPTSVVKKAAVSAVSAYDDVELGNVSSNNAYESDKGTSKSASGKTLNLNSDNPFDEDSVSHH